MRHVQPIFYYRLAIVKIGTDNRQAPNKSDLTHPNVERLDAIGDLAWRHA
jgi:hypothetical protein